MRRAAGLQAGGAHALLAAGAALLAACGPADTDPGPGGVTVGEARALDEAAEMLDARGSDAPPRTADDKPPAANAER